MPAWFDLPGMGPAMFSNIDWEGVNASAKHVQALIETEVAKGVPSEKIIVGGFSQGGAVAIRYVIMLMSLIFPKFH
jgi:phospholipase/carboxylesterase